MKNTLICILAALLSLVLAGCGSQPIFSGAATVAPLATTTPVPRRGGMLTLYMPSNPDTLDPLLLQSSELVSLLNIIYEPLVRVDETGFPAAYLAESWQVTDDGQGGFIWEFTLRDNDYFH
jgi:ABC-type transport system substrate-binding protein